MLSLFLGVLLVTAAPEARPDVVVVCPPAFRQALTPWVAHRMRQGHELAFVEAHLPAEQIRGEIRRIAQGGRLRFVLLVGDADPAMETDPAVRARCVPTHKAEAKVNIHWGSEPELATDNWYADLNDNLVPDLAIGRLTADSPEQLAQMVEKILAYERNGDFGLWRRRVNFVAGVGGFGRVADTVLETTTRKFISDGLPAAFATTMTYASWQSPFCPDPRLFSATTIARLNEGCLFFVYIGHGHRQALDQLHAPGGRYRIFDINDVPGLRCQQGSPIAFFMACYTGAFDSAEDSLAEAMLRTPGAPVAIIAGSRVTMPYGMAVLGNELMEEIFRNATATLGEAVLNAKQRMAAGQRRDGRSQMLDLLATVLSPNAQQLAAERMEHIQLFNLLGDPLLRLRHPEAVELTELQAIEAGQLLEVRGVSPIAGQATLELAARRDLLTFRPQPREHFHPTPETLERLMAEYRQANDPRWTAISLPLEQGSFQTTLRVPPHAAGPSHVRVHVQGASAFALGTADVEVQARPAPIPRVQVGSP